MIFICKVPGDISDHFNERIAYIPIDKRNWPILKSLIHKLRFVSDQVITFTPQEFSYLRMISTRKLNDLECRYDLTR